MTASTPGYSAIKSTAQYDALLNAYYTRARSAVTELTVPPVKVIAVSGSEPPSSRRNADAIAVLYGIAYPLKMGMK